MAVYVPIVIYGLRLFIVVLQKHCLPNCLNVCMIRGCYTSPSVVTLSPILFSVFIDDLLREVEKLTLGYSLGVVRRWEGCSLLMIS